MEGGWGVETEVHGLGLREADGGDVLVLRSVEVSHDTDEVDDGTDVGGVRTGAEGLGIGGLLNEVGARAVGEGVDDGLAVAVVEDDLSASLCEAGELGVDGPLEAVGVGLEGQGTGEEVRVLLEGLGVRGRDAADGREVLFDARLLEAGFDEVLRSADEGAGTAADGGAEGREVAAGFGGHEHNGLLSLSGDGYECAFLADSGVPGFDAEEPVVGRGIGVAAEEDADEEIFDGLGGWEVRVDPELVARLEIGDGGYGEGLGGAVRGSAGDADINLGSNEVETGVGCIRAGADEKKNGQEQKANALIDTHIHTASLDAFACMR